MTTQFARASYQEIIDLHTESDKVSVIGIHTPISDTPRKMFGGFFDQFKKFKYLGCSISLVPAARLPADPLQVSYGAGEPTIDPRDMLNPIMFHGCHGNDMGAILNRLYALNTLAGSDDAKLSDSIFQVESSTGDISDLEHFAFGEQLENLYYKALTDNTWKKAHPQRGFKKSGLRPMVYSMATNMQFNGSSIEMDGFGIPSPIADIESFTQNTLNDMKRVTVPVTQDGRRFFTPRLTGLGWLDTRNVLTVEKYTDAPADTSVTAMLDGISELQTQEMEASLPLVYMGMILMPPAYKTEQYFRMIVNHHFAFKDFRGISFMPGSGIMADDGSSISPSYANFNDSDYEYDGPTGDDVGPSDPDNPGGGGDTPEPDPVPTLSSYSSALQVGGDTYDSWGTFTVDEVDYSVTGGITVDGTATYQKFITKRDGASNTDLASDIVGYGGWDSVNYYHSGVVNGNPVFIWGAFKYGGDTYAYINANSGGSPSGTKSWVKVTSVGSTDYVSNFLANFALSPTDSELLAQLGTTTEFEDLEVDVGE